MKKLILFLFLVSLIGCAPGLGNSLSIENIPPPDAYAKDTHGGARVVPLVDSRESSKVAEIDGRDVVPTQDVGNTVRAALEDYLRSAGYVPRAFDVPTVGGSVERWKVTVKPGFPLTELRADAAIKLEVLNRHGKPVFRRSYSGESQSKEPIVSEDKVATILGEAMAQALSEVATDKALLAAISGNS